MRTDGLMTERHARQVYPSLSQMLSLTTRVGVTCIDGRMHDQDMTGRDAASPPRRAGRGTQQGRLAGTWWCRDGMYTGLSLPLMAGMSAQMIPLPHTGRHVCAEDPSPAHDCTVCASGQHSPLMTALSAHRDSTPPLMPALSAHRDSNTAQHGTVCSEGQQHRTALHCLRRGATPYRTARHCLRRGSLSRTARHCLRRVSLSPAQPACCMRRVHPPAQPACCMRRVASSLHSRHAVCAE